MATRDNRGDATPEIAVAGSLTPSLWQRLRDRVDHVARDSPARLALAVFAIIILGVTALLQLPVATSSGQRAPFLDAIFTATSAVCVTGLVTVDTAVFWSPFGQFVIAIGRSQWPCCPRRWRMRANGCGKANHRIDDPADGQAPDQVGECDGQ